MRRVAITGATGFLGQHLVKAFADTGWTVRVLARRDPVAAVRGIAGLEVTPGDLEDEGALRALCQEADVVIHAAGLVKARRDSDFQRINADGAHRLAQAARAVAPAAHVILVSSLAAREPQLSPYAASKRAGEVMMAARLGDRLTIVRPTAIYGPGDRETFALFAAAADGRPLPVLHPAARVTFVHVSDVARTMLAFADGPPRSTPVTICDDRLPGYSWRELTAAAAQAVGRELRTFRLPEIALQIAGTLSELSRLYGRAPVLTAGKAREILHRDWSVSPEERGPEPAPVVFPLVQGFADTVAWSRHAGWLRSEE